MKVWRSQCSLCLLFANLGVCLYMNRRRYVMPEEDRPRTHSMKHYHFVGLILASYVRSVWQRDEVLRKRFPSTEAVLAEMRTIRCIEHTGKMKFITPFVGSQVDICRAFGFDIPDGCAPVYVSKAKPMTRKRGRPAKAKVEKQEL